MKTELVHLHVVKSGAYHLEVRDVPETKEEWEAMRGEPTRTLNMAQAEAENIDLAAAVPQLNVAVMAQNDVLRGACDKIASDAAALLAAEQVAHARTRSELEGCINLLASIKATLDAALQPK